MGEVHAHTIAIPAVCFAAIGAVHLYFVYLHRTHAFRTTRGLMEAARDGFVRTQLNKGIVSVNTFRDYNRATVFFGTAAITIGAFIVGVAEKALRRCTSSCSDQEILRAIKYVVLAANAFAIFFNFSQATRFALHTQILMNTKASIPCRIFRRAHSHFAWGIRGFYLMIPLLAWVLTEYALAAVTVPYCLLVYYVEITDLRTASAAPRSEKNEQQEEEEQEAEHTTARVGAEVSSATL